ncbi:MAG: DNA polymerase III subunit beta [Pseudomonadota bacterium]
MHITLPRDTLLQPLLRASAIVAKQQTLPILSNLLFQLTPGKLTVTATDLEIELVTEVAAEHEQTLAYAIPARKLTDICKALSSDAEISLAFKDNKVTLRAGHGRYVLSTLPAGDYPTITTDAATEQFHVEQASLRHLLDKTAFAMAQQDVRYYLNGLLLAFQPDQIRTVATDGHRLAMAETALEHNIQDDTRLIIPRKAIAELGRLLSRDEDASAQIAFSHHYLRIDLGGTVFTTKLIEGQFPDYESILPSEQDADLLRADREQLRQVLARTAVLSATEKFCSTHFHLKKDQLGLQVNNTENDEAEEQLDVEYDGKLLDMGFNAAYVQDVLNVIETQHIEMLITGPDSSVLIRPAGTETYRYIVMPMRL